MKAILLAAGFGTRLRPLTLSTPKCLVEIKGKPLLKYWFENLTRAGINEIFINTHYLSQKVDNYILNSEYRKNVKIVYEKILLGTSKTIITNLNYFLKDDLIVIHSDNFCKQELKELIKAHNTRPKNCLMTMLVFRTDNPSSCGIVELDSDNIVTSFHEKKINPPGNLANAAVYIFSNTMLEELNNNYNNCIDLSTEVLPNFLNRIYTYETNEAYIDIGTPDNYIKANEL